MNVRVQLFALARDLAGGDAIDVDVPDGATVARLRTALAAASTALGELVSHSAIAINAAYVDDNTVIEPAAEVVLIPPVSGG
jgi:molybdopterin converting factor small subunit